LFFDAVQCLAQWSVEWTGKNLGISASDPVEILPLCFSLSVWWKLRFLGSFAKLWRATNSAVICSSVIAHWKTRLLLDGFSWNLIFEYLRKSVE
jgi:hypothetical protein